MTHTVNVEWTPSTTVQINLTFNSSAAATALASNAKVFLVQHKRVTCQMVTAAGAIVSATTVDA